MCRKEFDILIEKYNNLQKEISQKSIYLNKGYFPKGTIDPKSCSELPEKDLLRINANFFGPIDPEQYFATDFRILWLLKESYISQKSFDYGDRGGHNQALERFKDPLCGESGDNTYKNIIITTSLIIHNRTEIINVSDIEKNDFRKHVCILNVNMFPALCSTEATDSIIARWAQINFEFIKRQIQLYSPNVIIGGSTLQHFFPKSCGHNKHNPAEIRKYMDENNGINLLGYNIPNKNYLFGNDGPDGEKNGNNYAFWNDDIIFIDAYHPSFCCFYSNDVKLFYDQVMKCKSMH